MPSRPTLPRHARAALVLRRAPGVRTRLLLAVVAAGIALPGRADAQTPSDSARGAEPPRVFVDCQQIFCDLDFFRTEITWVDYVRDRAVADAHVLVTRQATGAGGSEYTLAFLGLRRYAGVSDTLRWVAPPASTDDAVRRGLVDVIRLGLVRYAARAGMADRLQVGLRPVGTEPAAAAAPQDDPWDYWVFRVRANGFTDGQKQSRFFNGFGSLSASRITADWKTTLSANGSYSENRFIFADGRSLNSYQHSYGTNALVVKSLSDHWSVGGTASASSSVFLNQRLALSAAPAVEYNYFPYTESTRRQLIARYAAGVRSLEYDEETIYDRMEETRPYHQLIVGLDARQPWGSLSATLNGSQYFHDANKFSLGLSNSADVRLFRGFSFNLSGSVSLVRDQLHIPKRGATDEEVLLQRRQLETSYRWFASAGLSYTFGSIYNSIVNPRFGTSGSF